MARKSRTLEITEPTTKKSEWNTGIYIRLSKEDGNEESYSVKNQKQLLLDYVESNGNEFNITGTYIDDGYTGTDSERKDFQRLLKDIKNRKINCVIVKDLSRLSRNYYEAGYYLEKEFAMYDVRFISLNMPTIDSYRQPEQMNTVLIPMLNVINDDFCRQTSLKIRAVFDAKRRKGEFIGAFAPYGYKKDPENKHKFIIDTKTAQVVQNIFNWFVHQGMSKSGIAKKLNGQGVPNPTEYKKENGQKYCNPNNKFKASLWSTTSVTTILKNEVYIGNMVQGRQKIKSYKIHKTIKMEKEDWFIVEGTHEAIISKELFAKAQELQARDTRTAPKKQELYLFAGFIRCADCKRAMHRKQTGKYIYYFCRTYTSDSKTACTKHTIRLDKLEKAVLQSIKKQIELAVTISETIEKTEKINIAPTIKKQSKSLEEAIKSKQAELHKLTNYKQSLYQDWKNGDISKQDHRNMRLSYEEKIEATERAIEILKQERELIAEGLNAESQFLRHFKKYKNVGQLDRQLLIELVEVIYVEENGKITINFKFADEYKRASEFIENNKDSLT